MEIKTAHQIAVENQQAKDRAQVHHELNVQAVKREVVDGLAPEVDKKVAEAVKPPVVVLEEIPVPVVEAKVKAAPVKKAPAKRRKRG